MARIEYPEAVGKLVDELRRLPGVGPRSAERIAIWLLQSAKAPSDQQLVPPGAVLILQEDGLPVPVQSRRQA